MRNDAPEKWLSGIFSPSVSCADSSLIRGSPGFLLFMLGCLESEGAVLNESECAVTGGAKRRDRTAESRKPNGVGAADERLQGTGRGSRESGIDL